MQTRCRGIDCLPDFVLTVIAAPPVRPPVESIDRAEISTTAFMGTERPAAPDHGQYEVRQQSIHGSAFAMHAKQRTRAKLWDENRVGTTKPKGIRNIDGGVSADASKGKLFFFTDWGGDVRTRGPVRPLFRSDADFRSGDFSRKTGRSNPRLQGQPDSGAHYRRRLRSAPQGMIFDPFTGNQDGTGRSVFSAEDGST